MRAIPGAAAYTASKAGVLGLVCALAAEVRGRGVRVAALCPGAVDTPFWDGIPPAGSQPDAQAHGGRRGGLPGRDPAPEAFVEEVVITPTPGVL